MDLEGRGRNTYHHVWMNNECRRLKGINVPFIGKAGNIWKENQSIMKLTRRKRQRKQVDKKLDKKKTARLCGLDEERECHIMGQRNLAKWVGTFEMKT